MSSKLQPPAQIDVLASTQGLVEPPDLPKGGGPHREVRAETGWQEVEVGRVVLHRHGGLVAVQRAEIERTSNDIRSGEGFDAGVEPAGRNDVVGVAEGEGVTGGRCHSDVPCGRGPRLRRGVESPHARVDPLPSGDDRSSAVLRPVVGDDDLDGQTNLLRGHGAELGVELGCLVEHRDDHGDPRELRPLDRCCDAGRGRPTRATTIPARGKGFPRHVANLANRAARTCGSVGRWGSRHLREPATHTFGAPRPRHTEVIIVRHATYLAALDAAARERPDEPLFTFLADGTGDGVTWSYDDLRRAARRVASQINPAVSRGKPVLLMAPPGLEYLAGFYGCLYAGAIAVPAYPPSPFHGRDNMDRLQAVAENAGVSCGLTTEAVRPALDGFRVADEPLTWLSLDGSVTTAADVHEEDVEIPLRQCLPDDIAFLQYTSGSTGDPNGVMISQGNLVENIAMLGDCYPSERGRVMVSWLPPYHDMGLIGSLLSAPVVGLHAVFMPPTVFLRRPARWLQAMSRYAATHSTAPNFAYDACVEKVQDADLDHLDLSSWSVAINGAEPVRAATLERFIERFGPCGFRAESFYPSYGMAETTLVASAGALGRGASLVDVDAEALLGGTLRVAAGTDARRRIVTCGRAPAGSILRIVDPSTGAAMAEGEVGEIVVAGPHVASGYWRRPELTAERFSGDSVRTGDLGGFLDGELVVTGRIKDVLIIRGRNHYPHDVEATVEQCSPAFRRGCGAAFTVERDDDEVLVVVQELNPAQIEDPSVVIEQIRRAVTSAHGVAPHGVLLVLPGSVPKTSSGKVRRSDTRRLYNLGELTVVSSWSAPRSAVVDSL